MLVGVGEEMTAGKAEGFVAEGVLAEQSAEQNGNQHTFTHSPDWLFSATFGVPDGDCMG